MKPDGDFGLYFNSNVAGLDFLENLKRGLGSRGEVSDSFRSLKSEDFDLRNFLEFNILRGSEESASPEDLGFYVLSAGLENNLLKFELEFDDPQQISLGL